MTRHFGSKRLEHQRRLEYGAREGAAHACYLTGRRLQSCVRLRKNDVHAKAANEVELIRDPHYLADQIRRDADLDEYRRQFIVGRKLRQQLLQQFQLGKRMSGCSSICTLGADDKKVCNADEGSDRFDNFGQDHRRVRNSAAVRLDDINTDRDRQARIDKSMSDHLGTLIQSVLAGDNYPDRSAKIIVAS